MKRTLEWVTGIGVLVLAWCAFAQNEAAAPMLVIGVEGQAGVTNAAMAGDYLSVGAEVAMLPARIATGPHSRLTLKVGGATMVRLGPETVLQLNSVTSESVAMRVERGQLYFLHREGRGRFMVETPTGTASVEGTDFGVVVALNGVTTIDLFDGELNVVNDQGRLPMSGRSAAKIEPGQPPRATAVLAMPNVVQWNLYYPAIVDPDELALDGATRATLAESLSKYESGNLLGALAAYPRNREPPSHAEALYRAGLLLAVGEVESASKLLVDISAPEIEAGESAISIGRGLKRLIALQQGHTSKGETTGASAAEWLAISYEAQSEIDLPRALSAAREAVQLRPDFSYAHARLAELEFSFGRTRAAKLALDRALALAPHNAQALTVRGFVLAAEARFTQARDAFDEATRLDPALGNAWLGRGLCRIHGGDLKGGLDDLQTATIVEPTRAVFRSYLGKAFALNRRTDQAFAELALAERWDPNDPTAAFYSALLNREQRKINPAVKDLERSIQLNENRAVYRSQLLLDQDRAVRGANLAAIYREAGLAEVGLRQASRAVASDYANHSAHSFLANSYNELRDPGYVNLRFETATFSEYLLANLLSPVGASVLSPQVSQQEYSRLFDRRRLGFASATTYLSDGTWQQEASQYGNWDRTGYALDAYYRSANGDTLNRDLEQTAVSVQLKHQLTARDSVYLQVVFNDLETGDTRQLYDPTTASLDLRVEERQLPNLFLGYHHEWSPGVHTLLLAGLLKDELTLSTTNVAVTTLEYFGGDVFATPWPFGLGYRSDFDATTVELQQIWQLKDHTIVVGGRVQDGEATVESNLRTRPENEFYFLSPSFPQRYVADLERWDLYAYDNWQVCDSLLLSAGVSFDELTFPVNLDAVPLSNSEVRKERISPKAGFLWTPDAATSIRGAYTRSLGGLFFDQSVRLEPTQVAGFNQAFRSLIPESVAGPAPGSEFETIHLGADRRFASRTYLVVEAVVLKSQAERTIGVFDSFEPEFIPTLAQTPQTLDYEERSLTLSVNQLVGAEWGLGARYRITQAELDTRWTAIPESAIPDMRQEAVLHQLNLFAVFNHARGFFARADAHWWGQSNEDDQPGPGDDFWQFNLTAGYRFPHRRAEVAVGLLNLTDQNYRLSPLNLHAELPHHRTFVASLRFNF